MNKLQIIYDIRIYMNYKIKDHIQNVFYSENISVGMKTMNNYANILVIILKTVKVIDKIENLIKGNIIYVIKTFNGNWIVHPDHN